MSLSDAGSVASLGRTAISPTPMGAALAGAGLATGLMGGKSGGGGHTYEPQFRVDPNTGNYQYATTITGESPEGKWMDAPNNFTAPGYSAMPVGQKPVRDTSWNPLSGGRSSNSIADLAAGIKPTPTAADQVWEQTQRLRDFTGLSAFVNANPNGHYAGTQAPAQAQAPAANNTYQFIPFAGGAGLQTAGSLRNNGQLDEGTGTFTPPPGFNPIFMTPSGKPMSTPQNTSGTVPPMPSYETWGAPRTSGGLGSLIGNSARAASGASQNVFNSLGNIFKTSQAASLPAPRPTKQLATANAVAAKALRRR